MNETWPNFFIVGAMKAGTSSLTAYLKALPEVCMSDIPMPHYFSYNEWPEKGRKVVGDKNTYLSLFRNAESATAIGETSTSYLINPEVPTRIKTALPRARIIIILRNPVQRAYSHYLMNVVGGQEKLSFYDALQEDYNKADKRLFRSHMYVEYGLYSQQVKRYFDTFGKGAVKVLIFEEFMKNTMDEMRDVLNFLEIRGEPKENTEIAYNQFYIPRSGLTQSLFASKAARGLARHLPTGFVNAVMQSKLRVKTTEKPPIEEKARIMLRDLFHGDIQNLQGILGRPLPWTI